MEVTFANAKLRKLCNSASKLRGKYGARMADLIGQRLYELDDVDTLEDMRAIVGAHCHELSQNLKGLLAVNLVHPDRLAFRPVNEPLPLKPDGSLDWSQVTAVEVAAIGDYH